MSNQKNKKGFSVLEFLSVVMIGGTMIAMALMLLHSLKFDIIRYLQISGDSLYSIYLTNEDKFEKINKTIILTKTDKQERLEKGKKPDEINWSYDKEAGLLFLEKDKNPGISEEIYKENCSMLGGYRESSKLNRNLDCIYKDGEYQIVYLLENRFD